MREENLNIRFGDYVKKRRNELKLSQKQLAKRTNKNQSAISQYENEIHFLPEIHEYLDLANALEVSIIVLMETVNYSKNIDTKSKYSYPIDLEEFEDIKSKNYVKLLLEGEEITEDEIKAAIDFINYKRYVKKSLILE
ncbi:helix-turn-helix domain-containing protein [Solibacillus sp. A46]|uniref:Helix-turn-helix domain-containing protein n=1 Tax=Solibacillus faecavium TaxID=2762221 RepID=A0ABR8XYP3_9BACL|nr:helix-turn-helix transcriptional regulator [Solibacillus faecavium]MBD8037072.1 helix-turn-helix domain-containing protein [Solibacillus faecavium]